MSNENKTCACGCHTHSHDHGHDHCHDQGHEHHHHHHDDEEEAKGLKGFVVTYRNELISALLLIIGVILSHFSLLPGISELLFFIVAVAPVALPVLRPALEEWRHGSFMNEFTLMIAAAIGAFVIGEYPEGVAVLLFYSFGEKLEDTASDNVRNRIKNLIGRLPERTVLITPEGKQTVNPKDVKPGSMIFVAPGEKAALDAVLTGDSDADFDTSAITGESVPRSFSPGMEIPAGCIPVDQAVTLKTVREFKDSSLSRIMQLIESASASKAPTETLLRKITRWYTPVVFILAALLFAVPWIYSLLSGSFQFEWRVWFERSLVFLVCSCPCALVVSIPLSYFASIGRASKLGVLFKGSGFIDEMRNIDTIVFDKTGTLTTGEFHISGISAADGFTADTVLAIAAAVDEGSAHPLAKAVCSEARSKGIALADVKDVKTISHGMHAMLDDEEILVGSCHLMEINGVIVPDTNSDASEICVSRSGKYIGSIFLLDNIKPEAAEAIRQLHQLGVSSIEILSGDRPEAVRRVAEAIGADKWHAELLPADKETIVENLRGEGRKVTFVGDGVNDAPAIAASNVGMAMGTMGTDIAMESSDALIAGDDLSKIPMAVRLSKKVRRVVTENISFALLVKAAVMILGAFGIATLWAAVFADTGVTLLTVLWTVIRFRK